MKKTRLAILRFNIAFMLMCCLLCTLMLPAISEAKKADPNEEVWDNGERAEVWRKKYGLVARDVAEVQVGTDTNFWEVYIRQRNEKKVREIDFFKRVNGKRNVYKTNTVSNNAKKFYPHQDGGILVDKNNRVLFTGILTCDYFVHHTSKKQCDKAWRPDKPYFNKVVERNVGKTWGNNEMFAYVKNNNLYITGEVISGMFWDDECYGHNSVQTYFKGRGRQIKQVVCGDNNIFVLMKDGSVWGIGDNDTKLISQSKQKKYKEFTKIIDSGVKQITASWENVAVIKKDQTLWIWGRSLHSSQKGYSTTPKKIADNVVEASLSNARGGSLHSMLVYLKEDHQAYGMGYNQDKAFGSQYKNGWQNKPVLLMKNVKHVYAVQNATLLLNRKHELYWSGNQQWYGGYDWLRKCK